MKTLISIVSAILLLMAGTIGYLLQPQGFGNVSQNDQYQYKQFTGAIATSTLVNAGRTTLGSVIITEDQAGAVVLYDATSTAAVTNGVYAIRIADFQSAEPEGVYTFDTGLTYGLVMVSDDGFSFAGDWTLTYRQGW